LGHGGDRVVEKLLELELDVFVGHGGIVVRGK
jgi:hypothetical protein